ncbi:MAG: 1-deoxy-D-xylulose-5-phosphate synthase [Planctomycetota bacterium]|jgi:1-deoxy-D-xylulose-5-phosphate synthase
MESDQRKLLDRIESPKDLQGLSAEELQRLAEEIRFEILKTVLQNGGHLASSLGVVELTIALHRSFDFSRDRLIFDVGHQCYPHKILTGRKKKFPTIRTLGGLSGFPFPPESEYDHFHTGHAGTSISLGLGTVCWDKIVGDEKQVVAVIGDASLGAGVALEALNWAGQQGRDMLIVLNDNEMSISRTVGALARYLSRVRMGPLYTGVKKEMQNLLSKLPIIGEKMDKGIAELVKTLKTTLIPGQLFEEFGCNYYGPIDGHDIPLLNETFNKLKSIEGLRLLHILTKKGKGYEYAVEDPETFHGVSPGTGETEIGKDGKIRIKTNNHTRSKGESYTSIFGKTLTEVAAEDERVVAITAAMPEGTGLKKYAKAHPDRYFDVGITEQHAMAFAGGLAYAGAKPVVAVYSTFIQRCYDQIFQEICLQNSNVVLAMDRGGVVGQDGPTHHGLYDIAFLRTLPRITHMSPKDAREFRAMIQFAIDHVGPVALRYPRAAAIFAELPMAPIEHGRGELVVDGEDILIIAYGPMVLESLETVKLLARQQVYAALINARFAKPIDEELIRRLLYNKRVVVTVEEHALAGGFGSAVVDFLSDIGYQGKVLRVGVPDLFVEHGSRKELFELLGMNPAAIAERILDCIHEKSETRTYRRGWASVRDQEVF